MDSRLLTRADADSLSVNCVAHGVRLSIFERDERDYEVARRAVGEIFVFGDYIREQLSVYLEIVSALFKGYAVDLLALRLLGNVVGVDFYYIVVALAFGFEDFERLGLISGAMMPSETSRFIIFAVVTSQTSERATQSPNEHILSVPRARA